MKLTRRKPAYVCIGLAILGGLILPQFAESPGGWITFFAAVVLTYLVTLLM